MTATKITSFGVRAGMANGYFDQSVSGDMLVYWQQQNVSTGAAPFYTNCGVAGEFFDLAYGADNVLGNDQQGTATGAAIGQSIGWDIGDRYIRRKNVTVSTGLTPIFASGEWMEIALRLTSTTREIFFRKVGETNWNGGTNVTADPLTSGTGLALPSELSGKVYPAYGLYNSARPDVTTANFGATAFAGTSFTSTLEPGGYVAARSKAIGMSPPPAVVVVANDAELATAIGNAVSGQTIKLESGTYAQVTLTSKTFPGSGITFTSDDPLDRAIINGIKWNNVDNATLKGVDVRPGTDTLQQPCVSLTNGSNNVVFDDLIIRDMSHSNVIATWKSDVTAAYDAWVAAAPGAAKAAALLVLNAALGSRAVQISDATNVTFKNSNIQFVAGGVFVNDVVGFTYDNNTIDNCYGDGLQFNALNTATITDSFFSRFYAIPGDHTDAIQGHTESITFANQNITIDGNTVIRGVGGANYQGIFLGNEDAIYYQNIVITNNTVTGAQYNGIFLLQGTNCTMSNNTVQPYNDIASELNYGAWTGTNYIQNNVATVADVEPGTPSTGMTISGNTAPPTPGPPP
jgi:parallel beta-helix repeat protein